MRLGVVLILLVLISICASKSAKSKPKKATKGTATKETKITKHKDTNGKHKGHDDNRKQDAKKKKEKTKSDHKKTNQTTVENKTNDTKANLTRELPSNCQLIVDDYSNGKILMYEYKIQMNRCIRKAKADAAKKAMVPFGYQIPYYAPAQQQGMPGQQAVPFFSYPAQASYNPALAQNQVPGQSQAAFAPSPMNQYPVNSVPYQQNMAMNVVARTNVPENPQFSASQANAVFAQWRASSFGAAPNNRKDEMPRVPISPGNDQFAEFMKMQSSGSSTPVAAAPSQQVAMAGAAQQRSQIQQLPNTLSTQSQFPNGVPAQGQGAFLTQPQRFNGFPARVQARTFFPQQFKRSAQKERKDFEVGI